MISPWPCFRLDLSPTVWCCTQVPSSFFLKMEHGKVIWVGKTSLLEHGTWNCWNILSFWTCFFFSLKSTPSLSNGYVPLESRRGTPHFGTPHLWFERAPLLKSYCTFFVAGVDFYTTLYVFFRSVICYEQTYLNYTYIAYVRVPICVRKNPYDDIPSLYATPSIFTSFHCAGPWPCYSGACLFWIVGIMGKQWLPQPSRRSTGQQYMEIHGDLGGFFSPFFVFVWRSLQL